MSASSSAFIRAAISRLSPYAKNCINNCRLSETGGVGVGQLLPGLLDLLPQAVNEIFHQLRLGQLALLGNASLVLRQF
jgi:hypothetical protein